MFTHINMCQIKCNKSLIEIILFTFHNITRRGKQFFSCQKYIIPRNRKKSIYILIQSSNKMDSQAEILNKIGVTHCGTYCFSCGANFSPHLWRRHFSRQHPDVNLPKKINNITSILHHKISTVLLTEDPSIYRANSNIYRNIKCTSCNGIFRDNQVSMSVPSTLFALHFCGNISTYINSYIGISTKKILLFLCSIFDN